MKFGLLSSSLNVPGGAEYVAINIIEALKENNHEIVFLSTEKIEDEKIRYYWNKKIQVDQTICIPDIFKPYDRYGIYVRAFKNNILKKKSELVIDNYSSTLLPWNDIIYIHYPYGISRNYSELGAFTKAYFYPYKKMLEKSIKNIDKKLIIANSEYTSKAIKNTYGVDSKIIYPPVSTIYKENSAINYERTNNVVTVSRFSSGKNLDIIPQIAKNVDKATTFSLLGGYGDKETIDNLNNLIDKFDLRDRVKLIVNPSREEIVNALKGSKIYLHTMKGEHFGISIIEGMSAGCIPVVPNSGGPTEFVDEELRYDELGRASEIINEKIDKWSQNYVNKNIKVANNYDDKEFKTNFIKEVNKFTK